MDIQHVNVKIFVEGELKVDPARFIDLFHEWIKQERFDELLIDVADYRHVPAGPGVMLIAHEADYSMDEAGHRIGLRYNRKTALEGDNVGRIRQAFTSACRACREMESHFSGDLAFARDAFELFVNDRALAPNKEDTLTALRPDLDTFIKGDLDAGEYAIEDRADRRQLFGVAVKLGSPFDLERLGK